VEGAGIGLRRMQYEAGVEQVKRRYFLWFIVISRMTVCCGDFGGVRYTRID